MEETLLRQANLRLAAGRAKATDLMPYLADALYAVKAIPSGDLPTLAIDGRWRMYYNPEFVLTTTVEEVAGAWLHEIGHPLREHGERFAALREPPSGYRCGTGPPTAPSTPTCASPGSGCPP